jgi:hypothetical protein
MYQGSLPHDRIISAFQRHVPGAYVRDYRDRGGYITICRQLRTIKWGYQTTTTPEYHQVPATTLASIPRGNVTAATLYHGVRLFRPGWRAQFRKAMRFLSHNQMRAITKTLGAGEVFPGVV